VCLGVKKYDIKSHSTQERGEKLPSATQNQYFSFFTPKKKHTQRKKRQGRKKISIPFCCAHTKVKITGRRK
jgi:hypothetical protein